MDSFATDAHGVLVSRDFIRAGRNDRALRRAAASSELVSILPGVFLPSELWLHLDGRERLVTRARALSLRLGPTAVFSHSTAAAILGYDVLGRWPTLLEITDAAASRTRRGAVSRTHAFSLAGSDVTWVNGLPVTAPGRTAVDIACSASFRDSVVTLDSALESSRRPGRVPYPLTLSAFDAALVRRLPVRCPNQIARVRSFVTGLSDSAGESLSRVVIHERGYPEPVLQRAFRDGAGNIGEVDFWWQEYGVIGEFDGYVKYSRGEFLRGRSPAEAAVAEKRREDRLRAHSEVRGFARWMYQDLFAPGKLDEVLTAAGLRR